MTQMQQAHSARRTAWLVPVGAVLLWVLAVSLTPGHDPATAGEFAALPAVPIDPEVAAAPLPDFATIDDVAVKKRAFFEFLLPMVEARNAWIRDNRDFLQRTRDRLVAGVALSESEGDRLAALAERYEVSFADDRDLDAIDLLLFRVDEIPPSLVLAQAASESGWGTSRFARMGNNLFGEWCFEAGCGIVPGRRRDGASHEVADFETVSHSIESYFLNLNTHEAYRPVRMLREQARRRGEVLRGAELAAGLVRYSERRDLYIEELRAIIRVNGLDRLDDEPVTLARTEEGG
ncbi:MAG: glucosaminidase domain-containing protein [Pseudomonadales bacterium]|jgi:Bax protein|nr:glucosaminidase domain-containing protein [Pseudomonadales bacterium]